MIRVPSKGGDKRSILREMRKIIELMEEHEGMVQLCLNCGRVSPKGSKFCDRCGAAFPSERPKVKVRRILGEV